MINYTNIITFEPGKRSGKPCIRGMRITVQDILSCLAFGMSYNEIINSFPELTKEDILATLVYSADKEKKTYKLSDIEKQILEEREEKYMKNEKLISNEDVFNKIEDML